MRKTLVGPLLVLFIALSLFPRRGWCAEQTPEQFLRDFYTWYITADKGMALAVEDPGIYRYVPAETVENAKAPCRVRRDKRDYFLKLSDPPLNMTGVEIRVGDPASVGSGFLVAVVEIISTYVNGPDELSASNHTVVLLKQSGDGLKIMKCLDIHPEG